MKRFALAVLSVVLLSNNNITYLQAKDSDFFDASTMKIKASPNEQIDIKDSDVVTNDPDEFEDISDFAAAPFKLETSTGQIPVTARLRIIVEDSLSAKSAELGDDFNARVLEDLYLEKDDFKKLIVPKNSWIRGKVSFVKKPRFLSRSGKLEINLDTLITPQADYVPLDAKLTFVEGVVNQEGLLDPQTGFSDKAIEPTEALLSSDTGKAVSIVTLGLPVAGSLIGGSVIALFSKGDSATVELGQELQIVITKNIDLAL